MKNLKILVIMTILFTLFSFKAFSIGAGMQLGGVPSIDISEKNIKSNNFEINALGTIRFFRIPAVVGFGLDFGKDFSSTVYGVTGFADYWAIDYQIENNWNLYSGFGAFGKFLLNTNKDYSISFGPRFFAGMNWLFLDNYIEYYAQLNISPAYILYNGKNDNKTFLRINLPLETGVRLHF